MKMNKCKIGFMLFACFTIIGLSRASAQVGMMGDDPDKSAVLDLKATDKGLLLPRITLTSLTDKTSIKGSNPATSLMVFNTNSALTGGIGFYYWDGSIWKKLIAAGEIQGDNLGNHTAVQDLNMDSKNINAVNTLNDVNANVTTKITTYTAQIMKSVDGSAPVAGYFVTAADTDGNIKWAPINAVGVVAPKLMALVVNSKANTSTFYQGNIWFDTKSYDPENAITLGTGSTAATCFKYVVQKKGLHQIFYNYSNDRNSLTNGSWAIRIFKNGTAIIGATDAVANGTGVGSGFAFAVEDCNAGDVITVDKIGNHYGWGANLTKVSVFRFE
ncbi:hypothetical protein GKZ90_0024615 [Flavobacterium sp. MC2016-06]|jgi:hypothetical protein|uniref:hypothetical protein n=1 Tax=Flavobacterium sp. MC2016-06 TaxID=2676308 RepID=UPI0012BAC7B8|nr:hypothetical protein [Flavobacterium sp. MC2016-06]MBU3862082.1 hypothetical protein [Flavobacterium sp. MC2016-06]